MPNRIISRLFLAGAATLLLGLTACSGSAHKSAPPANGSAAPQNAAANASGAAAGLSDAALQNALEQAAVTQSDLPPGWSSSLTMADAPASGGYSALYTALFSQGGVSVSGSTSLVVTLTGYSDAKAAAAQLSTGAGKFSVQSAGGKASYNANDIKLGDAAISTQASSPSGTIDEIMWRRGRVTAVVLLTAPGGQGQGQGQGMTQALAIARAQDAKLAAGGL